MDFQDMRIELHKDKKIGRVLFIVEGSKTEPYLLTKLFTGILDYQLETNLRKKGYKRYNKKGDPDSKIFVINAQESNIRFIEKDDGYLNNLFKELIEEYDFDIDNAAIFYIYDRDDRSNTDNALCIYRESVIKCKFFCSSFFRRSAVVNERNDFGISPRLSSCTVSCAIGLKLAYTKRKNASKFGIIMLMAHKENVLDTSFLTYPGHFCNGGERGI